MSDASLEGRSLGHYSIRNIIGRGGMATVYLADDLRHRRQVAVKVLQSELAASVGQDRFLAEITTTANLRHPNILPLYDSGRVAGDKGEEDCLYYVMPLVEGESLRDRLRREKQLPLDDALRITAEISDALTYAHGRGVVHRDIKPENILLESGHAVVADFGIARALDAAGGESLTKAGIAVGTPAYMSPEQAAGERDLDGRSDVYALGCVLYEMLAGQPPFSGPTVESLVRQHIATEPQPVTNLRPSVPDSVVVALKRALAKVPADRFSSAARLVEALQPAVTYSSGEVHPSSVRPASTESAAPQRRWPAYALAGIAAAVIGAVVLWRGQPVEDQAPSGPRLVVLPFTPVADDSALERMGRDLVVMLTSGLDGMGELRTVDAPTTLARVESRTYSLDEAHAMARRLRAEQMINGTLTRVDSGLRVDAALYAVGTVEPIARASVTGATLASVGDAAIIALLDQLWQDAPPAVSSLAAVRRSSVPVARRAYLEGELALSRGEMPAAIEAFERAFAADTSFWWAYWRSLYPRSYRETATANPAIIRKIIDHREELPEPDRLLIEASYMSQSASDRIKRLEALTARFPHYEPAWWDYANTLVHLGGYHGYTWDDARAALERVLTLNPRFVPAWSHLQWVAIGQRDTAAIERATRETIALTPDVGQGAVMNRQVRARSQFGATIRFAPESLSRIVDFVLDDQQTLQEGAFALGPLSDGGTISQIQVNRAVRERGHPATPHALLWQGEALAWAARGAWDSAMVAAEAWARSADGPDGTLGAYRLALSGGLLGAVTLDAVRGRRDLANRMRSRWSAAQRADVSWLDGLLAYLGGDRAALTSARRQLAQDTSAIDRLLERSLGALSVELAGDRAGAARELVAIERDIANGGLILRMGARDPIVEITHRLLAVRWLRSLGDDDEATRLLNWHESFPAALRLAVWNTSIGRLSLVDRAELRAAKGDTRRARQDLTRFLDQFDLPVDALQPLVARAQAALERLGDPPPRR